VLKIRHYAKPQNVRRMAVLSATFIENNKPSKKLFCVLPKNEFSVGNTSQRKAFFSFPNKK
jgi:hypothetical protein